MHVICILRSVVFMLALEKKSKAAHSSGLTENVLRPPVTIHITEPSKGVAAPPFISPPVRRA